MSDEKNTEEQGYETALAHAERRIYDQELAALANLALIRSSFEGIKQGVPDEEDLDERLRNIINDSDEFPSERHKGGKQ